MESIIQLFHNPLFVYGLFWVVSALASTMPPPTEKSGPAYIWLHNILQFVASNWKLMKLPNKTDKQ